MVAMSDLSADVFGRAASPARSIRDRAASVGQGAVSPPCPPPAGLLAAQEGADDGRAVADAVGLHLEKPAIPGASKGPV